MQFPSIPRLRQQILLQNPCQFEFLLNQVDEIQTMTSHVALEVTMRGVVAVNNGLPICECWTHTEDKSSSPHRTHRPTIHELVIGLLISCPRCFSYGSNHFVKPEKTVDQLSMGARNGPSVQNWQRMPSFAVIVSSLKMKGSMP